MRVLLLSVLMTFGVTSTAIAQPPKAAEPSKLKNVKVRIHGATSAKAGCSHHTNAIPCEGLERYRTGMGTTSIAHEGKGGVGPVVMYQVMSRPSGVLVESQAIAAVGVRKLVGPGWIQGGAGIARMGVGPGPRSIGISKTIEQPRAALAGGVGVNLSKSADPATLALDFGTTIDSKSDQPQAYQVAASVIQRF